MAKLSQVLQQEKRYDENEEEQPPCARVTFNICSCEVLGRLSQAQLILYPDCCAQVTLLCMPSCPPTYTV